jgi:uncharacterized protein YcfL
MSSIIKNKLPIIILLLTFISCVSDNSLNKISEQESSINIEIRNMRLIPENIKTVEKSQLTINIKSDTNGSIHFHGYDLESIVNKDELSVLKMNLSATGSFPVAFHSSESSSKHDTHYSDSINLSADDNEHGQLFESEILMSSQTYSYKIPANLSAQTILFHDHMSHDLTGEIMVINKGNISEIKIYFENNTFSPSEIIAAPGSTVTWVNKSQEQIKIVSGAPPGIENNKHVHDEIIIGKLIVNPR